MKTEKIIRLQKGQGSEAGDHNVRIKFHCLRFEDGRWVAHFLVHDESGRKLAYLKRPLPKLQGLTEDAIAAALDEVEAECRSGAMGGERSGQ